MTDNTTIYPRFSGAPLQESLQDTPVVLIHGSRQSGKTTLAKSVGYQYFSFDDDTLCRAAGNDPTGFVQSLPEYCILDEIQRVPELFTAIKSSVDNNRKPGRFVLTGSSNVLLLPRLSDSLAGRMEIIHLRPLAQVEIAGRKPLFLQQAFAGDFSTASQQNYQRLGDRLAELIVAGGYPAALVRTTERRRINWYRNFITTLVQRDVRDLARIHRLDALPRLLTLSASQTAHIFNAADLAAPFSLTRPTIREYLALLEQVFLIEHLPPWYNNRLRRLIKTPKLHLADTGLACALLGISSKKLWQDKTLLGQFLETFVYQELRKYGDWYDQSLAFFHFRNRDQVEVDMVIEQNDRVCAVEVKASATVRNSDFAAINKLKSAVGSSFASGILLYDGERVLPFGEKLFAVPVSLLTPQIA